MVAPALYPRYRAIVISRVFFKRLEARIAFAHLADPVPLKKQAPISPSHFQREGLVQREGLAGIACTAWERTATLIQSDFIPI